MRLVAAPFTGRVAQTASFVSRARRNYVVLPTRCGTFGRWLYVDQRAGRAVHGDNMLLQFNASKLQRSSSTESRAALRAKSLVDMVSSKRMQLPHGIEGTEKGNFKRFAKSAVCGCRKWTCRSATSLALRARLSRQTNLVLYSRHERLSIYRPNTSRSF